MVEQRDRLGIIGAVQPGFIDPTWLKFWIETTDSWQETLQQLILAQLEVFMVCFEVITTVDDMVTAKMFG